MYFLIERAYRRNFYFYFLSFAVVAAAAGNLQTFTGALGGIAPAVTAGGRGFDVEGNASFNNVNNALVRSCDGERRPAFCPSFPKP